jgi:hypothetical protein
LQTIERGYSDLKVLEKASSAALKGDVANLVELEEFSEGEWG